MRHVIFQVLSFILLFGTNSCTKAEGQQAADDDLVIRQEDYHTIAISSSKNQPGLGNTDGDPLGTALQLPSCIQVVDRPNKTFVPNNAMLFGHAQSFYVDVSFVNTCSQAVTVDLPAGLIYIAEYQENQNGLLVERTKINVPPTASGSGGIPDTTTIYIGVACLNKGRSPAFHPDPLVPYNVLPGGFKRNIITTDANLLKFLALLENTPGLKLTAFVKNDDPELPTTPLEKMYAELQEALWKITDGDGLTVADVKALKQQLKQFQ